MITTNGIHIVLCGNRQEYAGMSIAWATKVEKNHLILSVPKGACVTNRLLADEQFTVNVLAEGQENVAWQFGGRFVRPHTFPTSAQIECDQWNIPIVKNSRAQLLCQLQTSHEINQQIVITALILDKQVHALPPLIYDQAFYFDFP